MIIMKAVSFSRLLVGLGMIQAASTAQCNADNCYRAAIGTRDGAYSQRLASCTAFQQCTYQPSPTTQVETVTVYATPYTALTCPTYLPSSARVCEGPSRYASACSCAGITRSTTTNAQLTVTSTTTVTVSSDTSTPPPSQQTGFRLQVDAGAYQYMLAKVEVSGDGNGLYIAQDYIDRNQSSVFQLVGSMLMYGSDYEGNQIAGRTSGPVYFNREARGRAILDCQIVNGGINNPGGFLRCASDGNNTRFYGCEPMAGPNAPPNDVHYLRLGSEQPRYCAEQNLRVIPV